MPHYVHVLLVVPPLIDRVVGVVVVVVVLGQQQALLSPPYAHAKQISFSYYDRFWPTISTRGSQLLVEAAWSRREEGH